jgi:hypothetical protein
VTPFASMRWRSMSLSSTAGIGIFAVS